MNNQTNDTINKSQILNWLYLTDRNVSVIELGQLIEDKRGGKFSLVRNNGVSGDNIVCKLNTEECT
jgi:hypothetical protein